MINTMPNRTSSVALVRVNPVCTLALLIIFNGLSGCMSPLCPEVAHNKPILIQLDAAATTVDSSETIKVELDGVYKIQKRYRGMALAHYLSKCGIIPEQAASDTWIQFICNDGYSPVE